jgi:hypothetical protein
MASVHKKTRRVVRTLQSIVSTRAITYQLELVLCGKAKCTRWHGPYWYAYWWRGTRQFSRYVGKIRRDFTVHELRARERREKLAAYRRQQKQRELQKAEAI